MKEKKKNINKKYLLWMIFALLTIIISIIIPIFLLKNSETKNDNINFYNNNYVNSWTNDNKKGLLKNSKITNGENGVIFQDQFKNLWAMGKFSKLQVLETNKNKDGYVDIGWTSSTSLGLTKNSNIVDGGDGIIFQDQFKNLWAMGANSKLQVLEAKTDGSGYVDTGWKNDVTKGLLKNSNIVDGWYGKILQDSFKNLWSIGQDSKLQVLRVKPDNSGYVVAGWNNDNKKGLLKNSKIMENISQIIFQDSFKNLWVMGSDTKFQVLKAKSDNSGYVEIGWTSDTTKGLLKNSKIDNGDGPTIFQDKFKNLWAIGSGSKLQVLKAKSDNSGYVDEGWTNDNTQGLLKNLKINYGIERTIFQDKFKNLWTMVNNSKLEVLKAKLDGSGYVDAGWTNDNTQGLLKNSKIIDGLKGAIFQDKFNNLWIMGYRSKIQVLEAKDDKSGYLEKGWTDDNTKGLLKDSKINDGHSWVIFQDVFKNLWVIAKEQKLQVLKSRLK